MNMPINRVLYRLAGSYGLQLAYYDMRRVKHMPSLEAIVEVLKAMGANMDSIQGVSSALVERRRYIWSKPIEPVIVIFDKKGLQIEIKLPSKLADCTFMLELFLDGGGIRKFSYRGKDLKTTRIVNLQGERFVSKRVLISGEIPFGYHRFFIESSGKKHESLVISAPSTSFNFAEDRFVGVFLPLYSLSSKESLGAGDVLDLEKLIAWVSSVGGDVVGMLPVLATFLDESYGSSPYVPVSRLFLSEFYVHLESLNELKFCKPARDILSSKWFQEQKAALDGPLVDYKKIMAIKRVVMEALAKCYFSCGKLDKIHEFMKDNPKVEQYARFMAVIEKRKAWWPLWPENLKLGKLKEGDFEEGIKHYYLYSQWKIREQFAKVDKKSAENNVMLFLDLPIGVHPGGFDAWCWQDQFLRNLSVGAPPDNFFIKGQNWGSPPMDPYSIREKGYDYTRAVFSYNLSMAKILRVDHIMGMHRLFCIPNGFGPENGVYVHYNQKEMYAIMSLESYLHRSVIVGEDLGTVPNYVRKTMARHAISRMYILQCEVSSDPSKALHDVPEGSLVSLNTHDMPTFASFVEGLDIKERVRLGILDDDDTTCETSQRSILRRALVDFFKAKGVFLGDKDDQLRFLLLACMRFLAKSPSNIVLFNLEDFWLEASPQNMPGTGKDRPNWQKKARFSIEQFSCMKEVVNPLKEMVRIRKRKESSEWESKRLME